MPRQKSKPGEVYHTSNTKQKIADTQRLNVLQNKSNLLSVATCMHCGVTMQQNMIVRWHNDNCASVKYKQERTWSYISPKLKGQFIQ